MAQLITVRLNKADHQPLGFRLQGGKDFGTPLVVQKVNGGSAAERAGLQAGDALIRVNTTDVYTLRHQEAQDAIRAAGGNLELTVQRGGGTWRPTVTPTGSLPRPGSRPVGGSPALVTSTSLKATPQPSRAFGSGHNNSAKPFGYMNGNDSVKSIVNKQYNTPVNMYSDKTIAETLSAQTEVLAGGVLGVNFKKNEKTYDAEKSAVFKVLQEEQNDPEPVEVAHQGGTPAPATPVSGLRHVQAPVTRPDAPVNNTGGLPPGQNICEECERLITGVFVRIKDKNLHVECFKCSTCGSSLKNQGYYNLNGKLYCDIHAKLVARQNPPAPNLEPVTVPPGSRIPSNTYSTPLPPLATNNYTNGSSALFSPSSNLSGPKPFGSSIGSAYSPSLSPRSAPLSPARPVNAPAPPAPAAPAPAPAPAFAPAPAYAPAPVSAPPPAAPFAPKTPVSLFKGPVCDPTPSTGSSVGAAARGKAFGVSSAPKRGRGVLNKAALPGSRVPLCGSCNGNIRGPFITALGRIWCPEHFICVNATCRRPLQDIGFVEENGQLYCEFCFEQYIAPACDKCHAKIKGDCLNAIGKHYHPECFNCVYCGKLFGNNPFFLEDGLPYCEADWNDLFTTKCFACGFPVEAGDRWVEALNNNYHSQCFNCTVCKKNLEGQSFFAKGGRPFCKSHAR
ncbi:Z band alternatively spliced PDZ-motif protein 52 isoform X3 [Anticarsia gemmatalis]|uniref:Z band alternatively spliced PDZ-motif protein 52 isoform X3 n=1 Tax=Anticarsia gemmatalis TaxID=129554 RepID=UPI003F76CB10